MLLGTTATPEVNGTAGVCQTVTVPASGTLTFWVYEGTTDTISYVDQEADVENTRGTVLTQLYKEAKTTSGWVQKSFSLSSYAGQTVVLYFGVKGNGYAKDYVYEYVDDVSLTGNSSAIAVANLVADGNADERTNCHAVAGLCLQQRRIYHRPKRVRQRQDLRGSTRRRLRSSNAGARKKDHEQRDARIFLRFDSGLEPGDD